MSDKKSKDKKLRCPTCGNELKTIGIYSSRSYYAEFDGTRFEIDKEPNSEEFGEVICLKCGDEISEFLDKKGIEL